MHPSILNGMYVCIYIWKRNKEKWCGSEISRGNGRLVMHEFYNFRIRFGKCVYCNINFKIRNIQCARPPFSLSLSSQVYFQYIFISCVFKVRLCETQDKNIRENIVLMLKISKTWILSCLEWNFVAKILSCILPYLLTIFIWILFRYTIFLAFF